MKSKLKVGIAGYGVVGKRRRKCVEQHPAMEVFAICDQTISEDNLIVDGIKGYQDYHDLIEQELDVLIVCMTNNIAPEVTIAGLKKGLHVFCEKPPGRDVGDILKVIEVEKKYSKKLMYGFNHRYHDSVQEALRIIKSNELGKIINLRGVYGKSQLMTFNQPDWRTNRMIAGGGVLLDQGIHMLDLVRYFSSDYEKIYSFVSNEYWKHDVEDNVFILMKNKMGQIASIHSTATQWQHRFRLEINMIEGLLELSGILSGSKSYGSETLKVIRKSKDNSSGTQDENLYTFLNDNSWKDEIDEFVDCILNDKPIINGTINDALKVMEMIFKVYKSDKTWVIKNADREYTVTDQYHRDTYFVSVYPRNIVKN